MNPVSLKKPFFAEMKKLIVLLPALALFATSCKQEEPEKPKVIYKKEAGEPKPVLADSAQIEIADLPINISGTDYLLHPVGQYRVYDGNRRSGYTYERGSFTVSNYGEFEITGYLQNIKVQKTGNDSIVGIFEKPVLIQSATYLKQFADSTKQHLLAFSVSDMDTNQDGKLDANDIRTLYLGEMDGSRLQKITPDYQELIDWNYIDKLGRLYFRTIEDTNKSGDFDKADVIHYQYIDLLKKDWAAVEYKPV